MKYILDVRQIFERKIEPIIWLYIMIIIVIALSLIMFLTLYHYKTYYLVRGTVDELYDYSIRVYISLDNLEYFLNNDSVVINKKTYKYEVISLNEELILEEGITYQVCYIKVNLPSRYKYNNLMLELHFLKENKRGINYIIRR